MTSHMKMYTKGYLFEWLKSFACLMHLRMFAPIATVNL